MGSYMNFKNFGDTPQLEGNGGKQGGNFPLARQSSIYSLTIDELQNTFGGVGKDFGSMNMEDLLKNIWTAEETQVLAGSAGVADGTSACGNLQRQGSLTLPRTLSQKTVDEVWRDLLIKESGGLTASDTSGAPNLEQRQPTLGEMTLEEFLFRAGVVREDVQPTATRPDDVGFSVPFSQPKSSHPGNTIGFQQPTQGQGFFSNQIAENSSKMVNGGSNFMLNMGGSRSSQQQQFQQQPKLQPLFPKQAPLAFSAPVPSGNATQLASVTPKVTPHVVGIVNPPLSTTVQGGMMQGRAIAMARIGGGTPRNAVGSPGSHLSPDGDAKSNLDTSSLSPTPYTFGESGRGRRSCASLEKVVERRRRRMIKNRESAARSRARKQAYTLELEEEVNKLKQINSELQKKQAEYDEMQKNQIIAKLNMPWIGKLRCLRRTVTLPW